MLLFACWRRRCRQKKNRNEKHFLLKLIKLLIDEELLSAFNEFLLMNNTQFAVSAQPCLVLSGGKSGKRQSDYYQLNFCYARASESDKLCFMVWSDAITAIVSRVDPRLPCNHSLQSALIAEVSASLCCLFRQDSRAESDLLQSLRLQINKFLWNRLETFAEKEEEEKRLVIECTHRFARASGCVHKMCNVG